MMEDEAVDASYDGGQDIVAGLYAESELNVEYLLSEGDVADAANPQDQSNNDEQQPSQPQQAAQNPPQQPPRVLRRCFNNRQELEDHKAADYQAKLRVLAPSTDPTRPQDDNERQACVIELLDAMENVQNVVDKPCNVKGGGKQPAQAVRKMMKHVYDEEFMQIVAWQTFVSSHDLSSSLLLTYWL
jgi:hypothetical protein